VPSIVGYRCIKLGTVKAPLRLRWMQETPRRLKPLDTSLSVDIRRHGFMGEDATKLQKNTGRNGVLDTLREGDKGVFNHVVFVSVTAGMRKEFRPQVPIALVDDQPIAIEVNAAQDDNTLFSVRKTAWQRDVYDNLRVQINLFKELESLAAKPEQRTAVIEMADRGLKRSRTDRANLLAEKTELAEAASRARIPLDTTHEDRRLKEMEEGESLLERFLAEQKKIEASDNDPKIKKWRFEVERAKLLEKDLEIGEALDIYEQIQREGFKDDGLDRHLKQLQELWKTKDAEHKDARNFIYRVWPMLDTDRLKENLPKARKAFDKCKEVRDFVSIRKLLKGTESHADRLTKELSDLQPELIIDHEKPALLLKKVSGEIVNLGKDIQEHLNRGS
jgi:hypothetical protein